MADRFIRCQLCGMPHPADAGVCPVHQRPIVPTSQIDGRPSSPDTGVSATQPILLVRSRSAPPRGLRARPKDTPAKASTGAREKSVADAPLLGLTLGGRYAVQGILARGGMGVVYDAFDTVLGRRVAVKSLHRRYAGDRVAISRFQQEALVAGRLGHPNIVEVFDLGVQDDGTPWLVMERLDGETVQLRLQRERPLGMALAIDIAIQTLSALAVTHARGILHRDIKPANLFLVRRPGIGLLVKVLDYGVAKVLTGSDKGRKLTRNGMVMGTPSYMSPEQARGADDLDARADLYAVGITLYEILTGQLPFSSTTVPGLLREIQQSVPLSVRARRPELPAALDAVVTSATHRNRDRRYPDAAAMLLALRSLSLPQSDPDDAPTVIFSRPDATTVDIVPSRVRALVRTRR